MALLDIMTEDPDKKKKSKLAPVKKPFDFGDEMKAGYKTKLKYDNNRGVDEVILSAAQKGKIDPAMLMTSAWVEGLNKASARPDEVSEAYENAVKKDQSIRQFPVDGFYNYGLDTFGQNYAGLKKHLPEGFDQRFKLYEALNEKGQKIQTAAFKTNEDALIAKSAFLNMEGENVANYAKKKGIQLDDKAKRYFTLASYNGGFGNARTMLDEYATAKDKNAFIDKGLTSRGGVHKNISPRMAKMQLANELLHPVAPAPSAAPVNESPLSKLRGVLAGIPPQQ
jgi:hypothetical protein